MNRSILKLVINRLFFCFFWGGGSCHNHELARSRNTSKSVLPSIRPGCRYMHMECQDGVCHFEAKKLFFFLKNFLVTFCSCFSFFLGTKTPPSSLFCSKVGGWWAQRTDAESRSPSSVLLEGREGGCRGLFDVRGGGGASKNFWSIFTAVLASKKKKKKVNV